MNWLKVYSTGRRNVSALTKYRIEIFYTVSMCLHDSILLFSFVPDQSGMFIFDTMS